MHLGIDYGSKLAGTTAICYQEGEALTIVQSEKKQDADRFINKTVESLNPSQIFIDAPLSLPSAYFGSGDDYFYRDCDRLLKAMSPMFLGGLTARAIKLTSAFESNNISCYEAYPAALVKNIEGLSKNYNKKSMVNTSIIKILESLIGLEIKSIGNWHQIDSVLCWYTGKRFASDEAKMIGNKEEGQIFV